MRAWLLVTRVKNREKYIRIHLTAYMYLCPLFEVSAVLGRIIVKHVGSYNGQFWLYVLFYFMSYDTVQCLFLYLHLCACVTL